MVFHSISKSNFVKIQALGSCLRVDGTNGSIGTRPCRVKSMIVDLWFQSAIFLLGDRWQAWTDEPGGQGFFNIIPQGVDLWYRERIDSHTWCRALHDKGSGDDRMGTIVWVLYDAMTTKGYTGGAMGIWWGYSEVIIRKTNMKSSICRFGFMWLLITYHSVVHYKEYFIVFLLLEHCLSLKTGKTNVLENISYNYH